MSIEEIIKKLEGFQEMSEGVSRAMETSERKAHYKERAQALKEAIALLRAHPDAQPNEPLTLEDLRGMHEPVWVSVPRLKNGGYWCLCNGGTIIPPSCQEFDARDVKDWVFYRRPPKEA